MHKENLEFRRRRSAVRVARLESFIEILLGWVADSTGQNKVEVYGDMLREYEEQTADQELTE